jgi:predicted AlkP superfamily pyrophosphatase or phosphodiesterase
MFVRRRAVAAAVCIGLAGALCSPAHTQAPSAGAAPKLVVVLVVDQLRTDYLDRHRAEFTGGFRRLLAEGAWFRDAAYPYLGTVTCPGHATIGTGAFPYRHGFILNEWVDRKAGVVRGCTRDLDEQIVTYAPVSGTAVGESPKDLRVETLADQIRERAGGRVVTMSMKARSAIALAGRQGDAVVWFDDRGSWATSTAYAKAPVPFVQEFLAANPHAADVGKVWERALEPSKYQNEDDGTGERPPTGWTPLFPHPLAATGVVDRGFHSRWKASPFGDEYLGRMAEAAVDALQLGRGQGTDFLGVSFSTLDTVGHAFGPASHEVQDIVIRLDRTIGRLLDHLDRAVGRGRYVLALTSDHGVAPIPEQTPGGGRQASKQVLGAINAALEPFYGPGEYAVVTAYTDVYLAGGVANALRENPKARAAVLDAIRALPGVTHAFTADELRGSGARSSPDPVKRAAALSHHPERSGDIVIAPREYWILSTAATTHGTHHWYDQKVPVIFYGAGVRPGAYSDAASPADVAPTLAALARVRFNRLDGRALAVAVTK